MKLFKLARRTTAAFEVITVVGLLVAACGLLGQAADPPRFAVVSIKRNPSREQLSMLNRQSGLKMAAVLVRKPAFEELAMDGPTGVRKHYGIYSRTIARKSG